MAALAVAHQAQDRRRGFLDRPAGHVDDRPAVAPEQPARVGDLLPDRGDIGVGGFGVAERLAHARAAQIDQPARVFGQADDQRPVQGEQDLRQRLVRHDRNVGRLDAAVGQVDRGRRLRRARHPDQHDIGLLQIAGLLAVVVLHDVVHGIDALEIFVVQLVLPARHVAALCAEIGCHHLDEGLDYRDAGQPAPLAILLQGFGERPVEQGVEHEAGLLLQLLDDDLQGPRAAHHRPEMLDDLDPLELNRAGAADALDRLAGRIGDQIEMMAAHGGDRRNNPVDKRAAEAPETAPLYAAAASGGDRKMLSRHCRSPETGLSGWGSFIPLWTACARRTVIRRLPTPGRRGCSRRAGRYIRHFQGVTCVLHPFHMSGPVSGAAGSRSPRRCDQPAIPATPLPNKNNFNLSI